MQVLKDSTGNFVYLFVAAGDAGNPTTTSIGIGVTNQPYPGQEDNPTPTGFYWVPLPEQIDLAETTSTWTDWLQWDREGQQLWWGKNVSVEQSGPNLSGGTVNGMWYLFYYQEF
jgi:hypothetical protein